MARDLAEALRLLTEQGQGQSSRVDKTLPASPTATTIPQRAGTGGPPKFRGTGIASPLVETNYSERTFHTATQYASTDGIFVIELLPVKTINFKDALESPVTIEFKAKA